jgi:hypothetical protein
MIINLDSIEIGILLKMLNPFSHPEEWDDENLNIIESRIKQQISNQYARLMSDYNNIWYPGEWKISDIINEIEKYKQTIIIVNNFQIYEDIINNANLKIIHQRNKRLIFENESEVIFLDDRNNNLCGMRIDSLFL